MYKVGMLPFLEQESFCHSNSFSSVSKGLRDEKSLED